LSGFFSSSETALTALSEHRVRQLLEAKPALRRWMSLWMERPNRVLTTVLIGNNVVNTFTAALATIIAQQIFSNSALSIAVGLTTIALLVFGEITPKTFAKHNAEKLAPIAMRVLLPTYYAFFPAVVIFTWLSKALVRFSGGEVTRTGPFVTEEDINFMIRLGAKEGVIEREERDLIANVFEFGDTLVKAVMIPRTDIDAVSMDAEVGEILESVREHRHTRMPVYDESLDDIKGFFHTKDLFEALPDVELFDLGAVIRPPVFVPELEKISELLKTFQRTKTHLAVVVDEYGGTAGIVCLEDIIEEIVGEIRDEHDDDTKEIRKVGNGRYLAEGKANIHELGEVIGVELPEDGRYETVAGFVIANVGKMPKRGERIIFEGWAFTVLDVDARRVAKVGVERLPDPTASSPGLNTDPDTSGPNDPSGPSLRVVR
jgi:CBS domain containing-hemolysin-like protein